MKMLRSILCVITLVAVASLARAQAPSSGPATSATPSTPAKPAPKAPPRAPTLVSVSADDDDFAAGAAPEAPQASSAKLTASAAVPSSVIDQIRSTPHAQRATLIAEIGTRIDTAQQALVALRNPASAPGQGNDSTFVFQNAFAQARSCEQALRKSLQAARATKTASSWASAQAVLMRNYGDYAKAVAAVEAAGPRPVALSP